MTELIAGAQGAIETVAEHDGRSMAADLNDVLGGVGSGGSEPGGHHLIHASATVIEEFGNQGSARLPVRAAAEAKHGCSDIPGLGARDAHDAQPAHAWRRGDSNDSVVDRHEGIGR